MGECPFYNFLKIFFCAIELANRCGVELVVSPYDEGLDSSQVTAGLGLQCTPFAAALIYFRLRC